MTQVIERPPYALLRTMRARVAIMDPLQFELRQEDFRQVPEFATIGYLAPRSPHICIIDGEYVSRLDWWQPVREEDGLIVFRFAGTVHGGGGSDPLRVLLTIAVIAAAAIYGPAVGAFLLPAGTSAATAAAVGTAILSVGGTLLVNALLPPPTLAAGALGAGQSASPTYQASLQGNRARIGEPIPVRYGQERFTPDEAALPYYEFDDNSDQFYCTVLCLGYGEFELLRAELDDTDHRYFSDVYLAICGPGQTSRTSPYPTFEALSAQSVVADNIVTAPEVGAQELITAAWVGAFCPTRAGYPIDRVFFDVVLRLATIDKDDGSPVDRSIDLQFRARRIDDNGQPISAWKVLGTKTIVNGNLDTVRRSFAFDVLAGRYQFSMRRTQLRSDNQRAINDVQWIGLRGRLNRPGIARTDCTYVVMRVRANEQLSGSQKRVNVVARRLIPVYDTATETWSEPQFTRNAAHAFADVLHDSVVGRGLPDRRIDLLGLSDLADTLDERQDRFDYSFDRRVTVNDALVLVARTARARPNLRRGSVYTAVRDQLQSVPVALFMPRNMQGSASFRVNFSLPLEEAPEAVRMTYRDGQVWGDKIVWGQIHNGAAYAYPDGKRPGNLPEPTRIQDERIVGVIGEKHALREVLFLVGDALMRRQPVEWMTELEGTLPAFGSLVGIAHDVTRWGQSGDVVNYDEATRTLTASEPLTFGSGAHYVRLQSNTGGAGAAIQVTAGATEYDMVLAVAPLEVPVFADAGRERTRYLFGSLADVTRYALVRALRRQGEHDVKVEGILEAPAVHALDQYLLPKPGEIQDPLTDTTIVGGDVDGDPYFGAVVFLPKFQGGALIDVSPAEHTITLRGDATVAAAPSAALGYLSLATGADSWAEVASSFFFKFGRQPWTIEVKADMGTQRSFEPLIELRRDPDEFALMMVNDGKLALRRSPDYFGNAGANVPRGTPVELAMSYDGRILRGFIEGAMQFETEVDVNFDNKRPLRIGRDDDGDQHANATFYRIRITAGVCRYVDDYTVPASYPTQ